ncbi:MAG: hypothetical protein AB1638_08920 [Nitrospirota bacterium]
MTLCCVECGRTFALNEFIDEIDNEMWEKISLRPCDRV